MCYVSTQTRKGGSANIQRKEQWERQGTNEVKVMSSRTYDTLLTYVYINLVGKNNATSVFCSTANSKRRMTAITFWAWGDAPTKRRGNSTASTRLPPPTTWLYTLHKPARKHFRRNRGKTMCLIFKYWKGQECPVLKK